MTIHYLLSNNQYAYIINFIPTLTAHLSVLIDSYIQELQHTIHYITLYIIYCQIISMLTSLILFQHLQHI